MKYSAWQDGGTDPQIKGVYEARRDETSAVGPWLFISGNWYPIMFHNKVNNSYSYSTIPFDITSIAFQWRGRI
jgi:hypothetical protein